MHQKGGHRCHRSIEKILGWIMEFAGLRQFKLRGQGNVSALFGLQGIAYNLIRLGIDRHAPPASLTR